MTTNMATPHFSMKEKKSKLSSVWRALDGCREAISAAFSGFSRIRQTAPVAASNPLS